MNMTMMHDTAEFGFYLCISLGRSPEDNTGTVPNGEGSANGCYYSILIMVDNLHLVGKDVDLPSDPQESNVSLLMLPSHCRSIRRNYSPKHGGDQRY